MKDIFKIYSDMEREDIILAFKGEITRELLTSVYAIVESRLEKDQEEPRRKKKFYHIVVECLQNVYHHMETVSDNEQEERSAIFLIGRAKNDALMILTGNYINNTVCANLEQRIEKINQMNAEELRSYHLDKLSTTELSEKGGAGLGIIEIARKSGNKLDYNFNKVSEKYSFFSLAVTVR